MSRIFGSDWLDIAKESPCTFGNCAVALLVEGSNAVLQSSTSQSRNPFFDFAIVSNWPFDFKCSISADQESCDCVGMMRSKGLASLIDIR